ncbi:MAG TPA: peptidylprolyl isomerase [Ureibacillus sp.]|nr:peptidylprolyl isomerase [Ureibacillus sp.]
MKKVLIYVFLVIGILSACNLSVSRSSSILSFSNIENVPEDVQDIIDSNLKLQLINEGEKGAYIIFHSSGDIETDIESQDGTIIVNLKVTNSQDDVIKQHTYYLTTDPNHEEIVVRVNGDSIPFDSVSSL